MARFWMCLRSVRGVLSMRTEKMNKPTIVVTPSGDKMAFIPRAEYDRLVAAAEDAGDILAYDAAKRRIAAGVDEKIPADAVNRILDGESKVRVWREHRGLAAKDLAARAGVSTAY